MIPKSVELTVKIDLSHTHTQAQVSGGAEIPSSLYRGFKLGFPPRLSFLFLRMSEKTQGFQQSHDYSFTVLAEHNKLPYLLQLFINPNSHENMTDK